VQTNLNHLLDSFFESSHFTEGHWACNAEASTRGSSKGSEKEKMKVKAGCLVT